jgi:hypothetical protein
MEVFRPHLKSPGCRRLPDWYDLGDEFKNTSVPDSNPLGRCSGRREHRMGFRNCVLCDGPCVLFASGSTRIVSRPWHLYPYNGILLSGRVANSRPPTIDMEPKVLISCQCLYGHNAVRRHRPFHGFRRLETLQTDIQRNPANGLSDRYSFHAGLYQTA